MNSDVQPDVQPNAENAPNPPNGGIDGAAAGESVTCPRCGLEQPSGRGQCSRCNVFLPANQSARQSGIYAVQHPRELRQSVDDFVAGILADQGGESELTTLGLAYVSRLKEVEIVLRLIANDIVKRGLLTPSGGVRNIHGAFLTTVDRWDRLAQRIGVARKAKHANPLDAVREAVQEANR
ncbi:MAG: hypothetical protein NTV05_08380 [Acidobacteria bacterium]|nr:hypothetical protein [Acidobacteriota bacterium]